MKQKVLKQYPDAEEHIVSNGICIISAKYAQKTGTLVIGAVADVADEAWVNAYNNLKNKNS